MENLAVHSLTLATTRPRPQRQRPLIHPSHRAVQLTAAEMDSRVGLLTAKSLLDVIPLAQLLDDGAQLRLLFDDRFRYFCVHSGGHSIAASGREPPWVGRTFANLHLEAQPR